MDPEQRAKEITQIKKALRTEMRLKWEALSDEAAAESGKRITRSVLESEWYRQAKSIFIYVSVGKEPDTRALIEAALRQGHIAPGLRRAFAMEEFWTCESTPVLRALDAGQSPVLVSGVNTYDGKVTCKPLADSFDDVEYVELESLI